MRKHGCGTMNKSGDYLVDLCWLNNFVIGGTLFPHMEVHMLTWVWSRYRDINQSDHVAINDNRRRSLQDAWVRRGANIGSDHHLVTANIYLKLYKALSPNRIERFDTGKLRDIKTNHDFKLERKNRFQLLEKSYQHGRKWNCSWTMIKVKKNV